jgi:hydroxymethylglutaryl-CoA lyase
VQLIHELVAAGLPAVEVGSFVSPTRVPAMAGSDEVFAAIDRRPGVTYAALVPNLRGAEAAVAADVDEVTVTFSASDTYSQKNVGRSTEEAWAETHRILDRVGDAAPVDVVVSCAFGSPYDEDIAPERIAQLVAALVGAGAATVTLADTTGEATPRRLQGLLALTGPGIGLHLHDTRHTALLNAYVAIEAGVRRFDTSIGGLGGSPFADGAAGNLATEDLVHLLDDLGLPCGIDLHRLLTISRWLADVLGRPAASALPTAGPAGRRQ